MHWPADINAAAFTSDATLTVLSQHQVVRLARADTLTIDTTNGQCLSAVVLDHSDVGVRLDLGDGERVFLTMTVARRLCPVGRSSPRRRSGQPWCVDYALETICPPTATAR